ncbi:hypothetical protein [Roseibium algae]|uniref:Uncharacterized protein n=1 Tax=Roseibium algae TaxID=3123038 RepID=A0ABU8TK87_9HYPH
MSTFTKTVLTALAVIAPLSASAGEIALNAPMQGATLQENGVDMSVYFTEADGVGYQLVATYVAPSEAPSRFQMRLADGDSVSFSVPGHMNTLYRFSRNQTQVSVKTEQAEQIAKLTN